MNQFNYQRQTVARLKRKKSNLMPKLFVFGSAIVLVLIAYVMSSPARRAKLKVWNNPAQRLAIDSLAIEYNRRNPITNQPIFPDWEIIKCTGPTPLENRPDTVAVLIDCRFQNFHGVWTDAQRLFHIKDGRVVDGW